MSNVLPRFFGTQCGCIGSVTVDGAETEKARDDGVGNMMFKRLTLICGLALPDPWTVTPPVHCLVTATFWVYLRGSVP